MLSNYAAPFSFLNKAFAGEYPWRAESMPEIDLLIISHDHYDHLDYATIRALLPKVKRVVTPLGVGSHLRYWGMKPEIIDERDWNQSVRISDELTVHVLPARHFSGRGIKRDRTCGAALCSSRQSRRFITAGTPATARTLRPSASSLMAWMSPSWKRPVRPGLEVHPHAAGGNGAGLCGSERESVVPGHNGRFVLAKHTWNDPLIQLAKASKDKNYRY